MRLVVRACVAVGALALLAAVATVPLSAQGITTAAVRGQIVDETGQPVVGATVVLQNSSTGQRFQGVSRADGRYNIENVAVGGPYTIRARMIGYQEAERGGFNLALQQQLDLNLTMSRAAVQLGAVVVTAEEQDPLTAVSRTGTAGFVSDTAISRFPTLNRNFTDFVAAIPQVATIQGDAPSLGGGHNRMNNIQIDGVSDNDLFGLGSTGQPGGQVDAKSISLEAVKEYQVLIAPFDVRQSGFSGGVINAVTKRGTNEWHGSAFWYYQQDALVRDSLPANDALFGRYLQHQRGLSLGGPLLRDKIQFFAAAEWQTRETPSGGPTIGREAATDVQIAPDSAQRLVDIMQNVYGYDAGEYGPLTITTPNKNIFGRLDFQLSDNHTLTLRHNYTGASSDLGISRSPFSYEYSSAGYIIDNNTHSSVAQLNSTLGGGKYFNELRIGYLRIRDMRDPLVPWADVEVDNTSEIGGLTYGNRFYAGAERFSQRNRLSQDVLELTNDLTFAKGAHTITVGTHDELLSFDNTFFHTSIGQWRFGSLAALEAGNPFQYFVQIPYPGVTDQTTAGRAQWSLLQLGLYAQDDWNATKDLKVTLGVRVDVPMVLDSPRLNEDLATSDLLNAVYGDSLGAIQTDVMPSGNFHFSPRVGVNWDLRGDRSTVLRGGAGIFMGRPAYVWLSNAYTNTGKDIATLTCSGAAIPAFNSTTLVEPPQICADGSGLATPTSQVNYFDKGFKFPQQFKASAAIDQRLPGNVIGTVEFLYTKGVNTITQQEMNISREPLATNAEGRQLFGNPANFSSSTGIRPTRIDPAFAHILRHTNDSQDRAYALTFQLQKRFARGFEFSAGYTYQNVKDVTSLGSSIASSNYGFSPVSKGENPNEKSLTTSRFDVPHRIVLSGSFDIPVPNVPTSVSLFYVGQSGSPYSWTINGDANGDGYEAAEIGSRHNDIVFVPNAVGDNFTPASANPTTGDLAKYNALIDNPLVPDLMPCLKSVQDAGGGIPERNTCRNPWTNRFDASIRIGVGRAIGGNFHRLTLVGDFFNVLNLVSSDWGVVRGVSFFETSTLMQMTAYDSANDRGVYRYIGPDALGPTLDYQNGVINPATGQAYTEAEAINKIKRNVLGVSDINSRWRIQIGVRYDF
jgi:hypothetical protein